LYQAIIKAEAYRQPIIAPCCH